MEEIKGRIGQVGTERERRREKRRRDGGGVCGKGGGEVLYD